MKEEFHDLWVDKGCWNKTPKTLTIKERMTHWIPILKDWYTGLQQQNEQNNKYYVFPFI